MFISGPYNMLFTASVYKYLYLDVQLNVCGLKECSLIVNDLPSKPL